MFPFVASVPYFFFFSFLFILMAYKNIKYKNQIYFLFFLLNLFILFFYHGNLSDWRIYKYSVKNCESLGCTYFEPFFDYLIYFSSLTIGFYLIPLVSILLNFIVIFKLKNFFQNNFYHFLLSISVYFAFLPLHFGALRQSIAFSLLLLAFFYILSDKKYFSIPFFIFAIGFHYSSIPIIFLMSVFYLILYYFNYQKKFLFFNVFAIYFAAKIFVFYFWDYLTIIDSFNPDNAVVFETSGLKSILLPLERIIFLIISFYLFNKIKYDKVFLFILISNIAGSLIYLIFYEVSINVAGRLLAFFRFSDLFLLYIFFHKFLQKDSISVYKVDKVNLNSLALVFVLFYSIIKYYFTIVTAGFFA